MTIRLLRTALVGVATVCLLGTANGSALAAPRADTVGADSRPACAPAEDVRTVRPLERVALDDHVALALIPSPDQKYVFGLSEDALFWQAVRDQLRYGGPDLADDRLTFDGLAMVHDPEQVEADHYFGGVWRTECAPSLITADIDGVSHEAKLIQLAGASGWGGYYFDGPLQGLSQVKVTAYDKDGAVIAEFEGGPEPAAAEAHGPAA
ncbi:hypothetical protein [Streptomyces profundus]|uniref:hypothetical protein n=1 Tax=Streptomyces profundus TaxID=2867410 RepID=UPI001D166069|nr:hypothetical protein [Streptomyces sp. MA3_2.13]UED86169.1 hypothetical protein K4G22_19885 [Streptomyces sp. MA3_2.13]